MDVYTIKWQRTKACSVKGKLFRSFSDFFYIVPVVYVFGIEQVNYENTYIISMNYYYIISVLTMKRNGSWSVLKNRKVAYFLHIFIIYWIIHALSNVNKKKIQAYYISVTLTPRIIFNIKFCSKARHNIRMSWIHYCSVSSYLRITLYIRRIS